jgi:hypothetical protein
MSLTSRLAKLEFELAPPGLGYRFFYSVDDGQHFAETTQPGGRFDYRATLAGGDGNWADGAELITRAELDAIGAGGWQVICLIYGAWGPAAEVAEPETDFHAGVTIQEPAPEFQVNNDVNLNAPPAVVATLAPVVAVEVAPLEQARADLAAAYMAAALAD